MTGREKIEAALSAGGTPEIPAVVCYEGIFVRDHWEQLTDHPWWYAQAPDLERQLAWRCDAVARTGLDWFHLASGLSREERSRVRVEVREDGVYWVDSGTGSAQRLRRPEIGGWSPAGGLHSVRPATAPATPDEIDALVPVPPTPVSPEGEGRSDLAAELLQEFGSELYPLSSIASPLWQCYGLWGFEGLMRLVADRPDLVEHAAQRFLAAGRRAVRAAAASGAAGIWVEECMTDMISPAAFARLSAPLTRQLVEEIRGAGMHSIYYFCGDPSGKWDQLLDAGADAPALEESKKGFTIDIDDVVDRVQGRCAVLGNLDAMGVLARRGEADLRAAIAEQIRAGRRNGSRFVASLGSPVTPGTPAERVRLYCDLVHELGGG